jgi:mycothiol synthase
MIDLTNYPITLIDFKNSTPDEYQRYNEFENKIRKEYWPDDPPRPLDEFIQFIQNIPNYMEVIAWAAWNPQKTDVIALAEAEMFRSGENDHILFFTIEVLPELRQQGMGRRLLKTLVEAAQQKQRRLLMAQTYSSVPAGEKFMRQIGAQPGLTNDVNQLRLSELNRELLQRWQDESRVKAAGFELGLWEGPYPEDQIEAIARLWDLTNQSPKGDLEYGDIHRTADDLRQQETMLFAQGTQRWTLYVKEISSGKIAGYTEVMWNSNSPAILEQSFTGVFPEYRGKKLGRWLKAAMLEKVLRERPQVQLVRTRNANINEPMLKINHQLGFKPYFSNIIWQVETTHVAEYLGT